jgi:hypothetical protein
VTAVLQESRSEVADPLFDVLSSGEEANALQSRLSSIREVASDEADRVQGFSPPGDDRGKAAQHDLELAMNLRAEALRVIAQEISRALADASTSQEALDAIAGQMQALLASDVILLSRTKPLIDEALRDADVSGAEVQAPRVLTDFSWLDADGLGAKLGSGGGGGGSSSSGEVRDRSGETPSSPGLHGTSITGVTMGGTQLSAGASTAVPGRKVEVQVNNGGESDESQIEVGATFAISGGQSVSTKRVIATLAQGQTATVPLTLPAAVRSGVEGELTITVGGVPGESNMDNNKQTFQVTVGG